MLDYYDRLCVGTQEPTTKILGIPWETEDTPATIIRNNGYFASQWSDNDYEEMARTPAPQKETPAIQETVQEIPNVSNCPKTHVRIQVTQYENSNYVKGSAKNFEIKSDYEKVFDLLAPLKSQYTGKASTRVRVQLQNKVEGKMQGGRNLSLAGALVPTVYAQIHGILDDAGLIQVESAPKCDVAKATSENMARNPSKSFGSTEDGVRKVLGSCAHMAPPTPQIYHTSKIQKRRASLDREAEALRQKIAALQGEL